jgi:hypothetical protein
MELIATQPNIKYFDEPLNIRKDDVLRKGKFFDWQELMPDNNNDKKILDYLLQIERNKYKFMNPTPFRRNYSPYTDRIVYKIHEVEHLVKKIKKKLNAKIIFLFRHPIANTISRNKLPRLEYYVKSGYYRAKILNNEQKKISDRILDKGSHFEKGILSWCLQNTVLVKSVEKDDVLITYEEMVLNPIKTCNMMYNNLILKNLKKMEKLVERPAHNIGISRNTTLTIMKEDKKSKRRQGLVKKWKKRIRRDQLERAFNIIDTFGIDIYCKNSYIAKKEYLNFDDTIEKI